MHKLCLLYMNDCVWYAQTILVVSDTEWESQKQIGAFPKWESRQIKAFPNLGMVDLFKWTMTMGIIVNTNKQTGRTFHRKHQNDPTVHMNISLRPVPNN